MSSDPALQTCSVDEVAAPEDLGDRLCLRKVIEAYYTLVFAKLSKFLLKLANCSELGKEGLELLFLGFRNFRLWDGVRSSWSDILVDVSLFSDSELWHRLRLRHLS